MRASILCALCFFIASMEVEAQTFPIPAQTKSREYSWLESNSRQTRQFSSSADQSVQRLMKESSNFKKIERYLMSKFPADVPSLREVAIADGHKVVLSRKGFTHVVSDISADGKKQIFSTESLRPANAQVIHLTLSPSREYLVIVVQLNGSIDLSRYVIYELKTRKIKSQFDGLSYMEPPAWNAANELVTMHPDSSPQLTSAMYVDLDRMTFKTVLNHDVFNVNGWTSVTSPGTQSGSFTKAKTGERLEVRAHISFLNAVAETKDAFYYVLHVFTDGTIFRLKKENPAVPESFILPREGHWLSSIQVLNNKFLLVNYSRDSLVTLVLHDLRTGSKISELALPDNYDLSGPTYDAENEQVVLGLYNFLGQQHTVRWDPSNSSSTDFSGLPTTFIQSGVELVSKLEQFSARDGESIPARITYLKGTAMTGENPVYMETYGAFNYISGYLTLSLDDLKLEFLKRGGIIVGTGVRGGAERGYPWYLSGTGKNKATPAYDLIAIANGLVERGYTKAEKIVSTGVSAGADNVAVAAQLSPESFGLIIPISGGHDALGYPLLDRWGPQWYFDYLDPFDALNFDSIFARAALELKVPSSRYPAYLIVCGESDTRVNKVHSYKLKAVLDEFVSDGVHLYIAKKSGHWPSSTSLHGRQGMRSEAIIWSRVFDYLGLNFGL